MQLAPRATLPFCPVWATEPEPRLGAIVDFTFDLGEGLLQTSSLRRRVNQRHWAEAVSEPKRRLYDRGRVLPWLVALREADASSSCEPPVN